MLELSLFFPPPNTSEIIEFRLLFVAPGPCETFKLSGKSGTGGGAAPALSALRWKLLVDSLAALCLPLPAGLDAALFLDVLTRVRVEMPAWKLVRGDWCVVEDVSLDFVDFVDLAVPEAEVLVLASREADRLPFVVDDFVSVGAASVVVVS